jgi:hypothetical protein
MATGFNILQLPAAFSPQLLELLLTLLAAGYVSVRNNKEEPCSVSSDEWFLRKYSLFSYKIFPRDIFIAFYGNFRPCFQHISLRNIFPCNLSFGNNNKMPRNEALQSCFQRKYYWVPAVSVLSFVSNKVSIYIHTSEKSGAERQ